MPPPRIELMKSITATNYQKDTLYPAVAGAVWEILKTTNVVTPLELLLRCMRPLKPSTPRRGGSDAAVGQPVASNDSITKSSIVVRRNPLREFGRDLASSS